MSIICEDCYRNIVSVWKVMVYKSAYFTEYIAFNYTSWIKVVDTY